MSISGKMLELPFDFARTEKYEIVCKYIPVKD